jgi:hypothetical protein
MFWRGSPAGACVPPVKRIGTEREHRKGRLSRGHRKAARHSCMYRSRSCGLRELESRGDTDSRPHECGDEVLARAARRQPRSMTPDLFSTASAGVPLPSPNPPPSLHATADTPTASFRRHVLPKDLPAAIKQLDDQELDRLLAAAVAEQKRRGRKPAVSVEPPDKPRIEAAVVHFDAWKDERCSRRLQGWRQAIADRSAVRLVPVRGRRWRAMHQSLGRT